MHNQKPQRVFDLDEIEAAVHQVFSEIRSQPSPTDPEELTMHLMQSSTEAEAVRVAISRFVFHHTNLGVHDKDIAYMLGGICADGAGDFLTMFDLTRSQEPTNTVLNGFVNQLKSIVISHMDEIVTGKKQMTQSDPILLHPKH